MLKAQSSTVNTGGGGALFRLVLVFFLSGIKQDICQKTAFKGEEERSERKFPRFVAVLGKMNEGKIRMSSVLMLFPQMLTSFLLKQHILNSINSTGPLPESHSKSASALESGLVPR